MVVGGIGEFVSEAFEIRRIEPVAGDPELDPDTPTTLMANVRRCRNAYRSWNAAFLRSWLGGEE
jgi:hypothetical protein